VLIAPGGHLASLAAHQRWAAATAGDPRLRAVSRGQPKPTWYDHRQYEAANGTGGVCDFDERNIYAVTPVHQSLLKLASLSMAQAHSERNDLLSWFVALADGYTISYHDGDDDGVKQAMKESGEEIAAEEKEATLSADPVDHEALEAHRKNGTLTPVSTPVMSGSRSRTR
jgi:hypothetical protein